MPVRPTIYDVAREAGLSKSLVSLVLQGSPKVSDASRAAVEAAIAKLGYRPSRVAAQLATGSGRLVGVLIDDFANLWFVDLVRGLREVLEPEGYRLSVVDAASGRGEHPAEELLSMRVDGLVVAMDIPALLEEGTTPPVVVAGTRGEPAWADGAANDDAAGAELATRHLLDLGHRVIGHLGADGGAATARRRSFERVMAAADARAVLVDRRGIGSEAEGFVAAQQLLRGHPEVTAVFAANDELAVGALGAARALGIAVPERLSIIGYDDTPLAATRLVDLTTIDDASIAVGREAGALLLRRMRRAAGAPRRITIEPSLVVRGTTAPPAQS